MVAVINHGGLTSKNLLESRLSGVNSFFRHSDTCHKYTVPQLFCLASEYTHLLQMTEREGRISFDKRRLVRWDRDQQEAHILLEQVSFSLPRYVLRIPLI